MKQDANGYKKIIDNLISWARTQQNIHGAAIIGSQARIDHPADEWSDLDLWIIATHPDFYLSTTDWIENIGTPLITFQQEVLSEGRERRVLFTNGLDVDFAFDSPEQFQKCLRDNTVLDIIRRGIKIILDKNGEINRKINNLPPFSFPKPPTQDEFHELIHVFWYRAQWAAKRLRRGELWVGKRSCDTGMKELLLKLIEWHTHASNGWDYDTWHRGSFLEEWASPRIIESLQNVYAHYNENDAWDALNETINLFRTLSSEFAGLLDYQYPADIDNCITKLINSIRIAD